MGPSGIFATTGGRRFFLALFVAVTNIPLLWAGKMSDSIFRDIVLGVIAVYVAGNVIQKIKAPESGGDA